MLSMDAIEAPTLARLPLKNGTVVVVGAYKGDTTEFIVEHHPGVRILAWEPQIWAALQIPTHDGQVRVYPYALGMENGQKILYESGTDAASLLRLPNYRTRTYVDVKDARQVFGFLGLTEIDLLFLNIEGSEYELIPYLLDYGLPVATWMVQFHFLEKYGQQFANIRDRMHTGRFLGKGWWVLT